MQFPNQQGGVGNQVNSQITPQQLAAVLQLLAKQPQANPTSTQFDPNYFSQLYSLRDQQGASLQTFPQPSPPPMKPQPTCSYQVVKTVDDPSTIQPQEVVMGFMNLFPSNDGDKIFVKSWNTEGSIETKTYVEVQNGSKTSSKPTKKTAQEQSMQDQFELFSSKIMARMAELELTLSKIQSSNTSRSRSKPKPKKSGGLLTPANEPTSWVGSIDETPEELVQIYEEEAADE